MGGVVAFGAGFGAFGGVGSEGVDQNKVLKNRSSLYEHDERDGQP